MNAPHTNEAARYPSPCRTRNQTAACVSLLFCVLHAIRADAWAAELVVGPGARFAQPSEAATVAQSGDTVRILPGTFYDCAVWRADGLVIEGSGPATRITDRVCHGKAIFVVMGDNIRIRDITLARARNLDGYGAAIRAEGRTLTLERLLIEDNQDGIFAPGEAQGSTLRIEDSIFRANGAASNEPSSAAIRAGPLAALVLRGSVFEAGRGTAAILSRARMTEIAGSRIAAVATGSGATIQVDGGLRITASVVAPGVGPRGRRAAILALPGHGAAGDLEVTETRLDGPGVLLLNWSGRSERLAGNAVPAGSAEATQAGMWWSALRRLARQVIDGAIALMRLARTWLHEVAAKAGW
ncbi:hypothetical protein KPL78_06805 [Roseomonas sp. HJA6]|uniref:Right-handed parallel beta-helix repeat-containing protein n=1 Tax=Roseomonas alba TaxID=2846776 RepID=A0ABS7A5I6_9PROT|nr:hypothetical protein [Neoroseomonas alba]MBW6397548.1 hypothetical protein [Neoroseomonas alba]